MQGGDGGSGNDRPALRGGLLCAACGLIHGRCGDAVYPLLRKAGQPEKAIAVRDALKVDRAEVLDAFRELEPLYRVIRSVA